MRDARLQCNYFVQGRKKLTERLARGQCFLQQRRRLIVLIFKLVPDIALLPHDDALTHSTRSFLFVAVTLTHVNDHCFHIP